MNTVLVRREKTCCVAYNRETRKWRICSLAEGEDLSARPDTQVIDYSSTPSVREVRFGAPIVLFLDITSECQCKCWYCYKYPGGARHDELTAEEIRRLVRRFAALGGVELRLAGGEPTLHPDLIDFLELGDTLRLRTVLVTNGLISPSLLELLARTPVTVYYISIQGDEPTNDSIRGKGSYRRCVESAGYLVSHGAAVRLSMVFHKQNQHCVTAVADVAARIGANVAFNPLRPLGRATPAMMLSPEEHRRLVFEVVGLRRRYPGMRIDTPWDYLASPPGPLQHLPYKRLGCGDTSISVTPEGNCFSCGQLSGDSRFILGNVRGGDLASIWLGARETCPLANAVLHRQCRSCPYLERSACFGGCAATALSVSGGLDAGDPYCFVKLVGAEER